LGGEITGWLAKVRGAARHPPRGLLSADDLDFAAMIDREQVLHVAKLARLRLSEEEVETMVGELSGILEHVDRIGRLDLDGVEPTSHVVALENVLRADEPRPSLPREVALASAPEPQEGAFRVPSPQAE
jgi:aspartyl-tRNA(Asn)/glutamyl-tRNA(Gln) amidotransferase subunit C